MVLAGSVVRSAYDWAALTTRDEVTGQIRSRVQAVRNYVGTEDWVVALFPRLFELPVATSLRNSIGSAGFNGFDDDRRVDNVRFVKGAHGAFEKRVDEIVEFLLAPDTTQEAVRENRPALGHLMSVWPSVIVTWALLVFIVVGLGIRVVAASSAPAWPVLLAYVLLVTAILRTV